MRTNQVTKNSVLKVIQQREIDKEFLSEIVWQKGVFLWHANWQILVLHRYKITMRILELPPIKMGDSLGLYAISCWSAVELPKDCMISPFLSSQFWLQIHAIVVCGELVIVTYWGWCADNWVAHSVIGLCFIAPKCAIFNWQITAMLVTSLTNLHFQKCQNSTSSLAIFSQRPKLAWHNCIGRHF